MAIKAFIKRDVVYEVELQSLIFDKEGKPIHTVALSQDGIITIPYEEKIYKKEDCKWTYHYDPQNRDSWRCIAQKFNDGFADPIKKTVFKALPLSIEEIHIKGVAEAIIYSAVAEDDAIQFDKYKYYDDKGNVVEINEEYYTTYSNCLFDHEILVKNIDGTTSKEGGYRKKYELTDDQKKLVDELLDVTKRLKEANVSLAFNTEACELFAYRKNIDCEGYDNVTIEYEDYIESEDLVLDDTISMVKIEIPYCAYYGYDDHLVAKKTKTKENEK